MHVALNNNRNVNYVFHVLRNDTCMFAMELTHNYVKQEGEDFTSECLLSLSVTSSQYVGENLFSASTTTRYHGVCSYLSGNRNAIKKGEDPVNEEAITYTEKQTLYGTLDPVTSDKGIVANLTERAQEIEAMTYSSGYWYIRDLEELTAPVWREGKFPYRFTISDIKLNIATSDEEGLKYIVNIKGLPTDCNLQTDKKNLRFSR